jgi:hypothetical protein
VIRNTDGFVNVAREHLKPLSKVANGRIVEPLRSSKGQQIVNDDVQRCAIPTPSAQLIAVFWQQMSRKVETQKLIGWAHADRLTVQVARSIVEEVYWCSAISASIGGVDRRGGEPVPGALGQFCPNSPDNTLDASLSVVTNNRRDIDEQARQIARTLSLIC